MRDDGLKRGGRFAVMAFGWWRTVLILVSALLLMPRASVAGDPPADLENAPPDRIFRQATIDALAYQYEKWFPLLRRHIAGIDSLPPAAVAKPDLMKLCFYLAALNIELANTLAFSAEYKDEAVEKEFLSNLRRAKELARDIIAMPDATKHAEAYFYLGASEGYLAVFEYIAGNLLSALVNGLQADNHLEQAVALDPALDDAYLGLGIYRYGTSRVGGFGNLILQGGRDLRLEGIRHVERAGRSGVLSRPLALQTLVWFYISEQINPRNVALPPEHPLSPKMARAQALDRMSEFEKFYNEHARREGVPGNKNLSLMKAVQHVLDENYPAARNEFLAAGRVARFLKEEKRYPVNPKLADTIDAGARFGEIMGMAAAGRRDASLCARIDEEIRFLDRGGSFIERGAKRLRGEIQKLFAERLKKTAQESQC